MSKKQSIILGTILLTVTSFISRFIGFFFRIFLSHTFGEEQIGLYQLVFPIYALCFSLTSAGIELSLSRHVAKETSLGNKGRALIFLYISLVFSVLLSIVSMLIIQQNATFLSIFVLGDLRCEEMIITISYALPFASIHSCICGYFLGLKQANLTACSQLVEQIARVGSIFLLCKYLFSNISSPNIIFAVYGIVISEFVSSLFCVYYFIHQKPNRISSLSFTQLFLSSKELLVLAVPVTINRIFTNLLQSVESISIPLSLQKYGYSNSEALINFGVLTGMVLPCILFPSAITNSVATVILPTITEIQTTKNLAKLRSIIQKVFSICMLLGLFSCCFFFLFSNLIGKVIFGSAIASKYLKVLCWICPFLYTNVTLASIINGLGKTNITFFINCIGLFIRIISIVFFIPSIGMVGYLLGLLTSQLFSFFLHLLFLLRFLQKNI